MWYFLYNVLFTVLFVSALPLLPVLACLGARYREGLEQRLGFYSKDVVSSLVGSRPVWLHAASVGEVLSVKPLVAALKAQAPARKILISTFTATGNRQARQIDDVDAVIFFPLDVLWIVRRALTKFDPALLVIVETEIWPNLLRQAYYLGVPVVLLSGRLSAKATARYTVCRSLFSRALDYFAALGMQSAEDAARIVSLGADEKKVSVVGTLKAMRANPADSIHNLARSLDGKPLLVAGSTHRGEEESLLEALKLVRARHPNLSMVIAPRHPERFGDVERLLANSKFVFQRRSQTAPADWFKKDILLLDSVGELAHFFAVGDVAFVGGSLVEVGGHNILEPAGVATPILVGPHMENFQALADTMLRQGAALEVASAAALADALDELLADSMKRRRMGQRAKEIAVAHQGAFALNFSLAERYL